MVNHKCQAPKSFPPKNVYQQGEPIATIDYDQETMDI